MLKIATHNSATGEKGNWWSWLFWIFAKTQSKSIKEQYEAGCRLFDIRIRKVLGEWKCAHGPWVTSRDAEEIIKEINNFPERCSMSVTYEGGWDNSDEFIEYVRALKSRYPKIGWGGIAIKKGKESKGVNTQYDYVEHGDPGWIDAPSRQGFLPLDGRSWHTYIPIPWLWKKIYHNNPEFKEDIYTYVDFL